MRTCVFLFVFAIFTCPAHGQFVYEFIEDFDRVVFATLELSELPATEESFVKLTFSPRGERRFGFGSTYLGTFDEMTTVGGIFFATDSTGFPQVDAGGLAGTDDAGEKFAIMRDLDPPTSTTPNLPEGSTDITFNLRASQFSDRGDFDSLAEMSITYRTSDGTEGRFGALGVWQAVPEPSTFWPGAIGALLLVSRRRK